VFLDITHENKDGFVEANIFFDSEVSGTALEKAVWGKPNGALKNLKKNRSSVCPEFLLDELNEDKTAKKDQESSEKEPKSKILFFVSF